MVVMRVRQEKIFHAQLLRVDEFQKLSGICASIEDGSIFRDRIPNEIGIHSHIQKGGGKLFYAVGDRNILRIPALGVTRFQSIPPRPSARASPPIFELSPDPLFKARSSS